jgi:hypothetical protein
VNLLTLKPCNFKTSPMIPGFLYNFPVLFQSRNSKCISPRNGISPNVRSAVHFISEKQLFISEYFFFSFPKKICFHFRRFITFHFRINITLSHGASSVIIPIYTYYICHSEVEVGFKAKYFKIIKTFQVFVHCLRGYV